MEAICIQADLKRINGDLKGAVADATLALRCGKFSGKSCWENMEKVLGKVTNFVKKMVHVTHSQ